MIPQSLHRVVTTPAFFMAICINARVVVQNGNLEDSERPDDISYRVSQGTPQSGMRSSSFLFKSILCAMSVWLFNYNNPVFYSLTVPSECRLEIDWNSLE